MMQRYIKPLALLVGILLVGGGVGLVTRSGGDDTFTVTAYFEKAIGLFENSDVNILGVPVGKVTAVEPEGSKVKVIMEVSDRYDVPADAFAQIVPISVIADRFVQLHPAYTGGPTMADGAVLELDRTQIPAELDDVFKQLKKLLEAIEPGQNGEPGALGELVVALNDALGDREDDLRGTVVNTAALTGALSDAQEDLSDILINLDDLFGTLAQRAGSIGTLNNNFALVVTALAESRDDLEGTLANLADMTGEVGRVLREHRSRLGGDLELAGNILSKVLENRASVEESLQWLPVIGIGVSNAYHGGQNLDIDVRDNASQRLNCDLLETLPPGPIRDALEQACRENTAAEGADGVAPTAPKSGLDRTIDCDEGIKKVRRQLRRLVKVDLPPAILEEVVRPLRKKVRLLGRECEELGRAISKPGGILDDLRDGIGDIPILDDADVDLDGDLNGLAGAAAGSVATDTSAPSLFDGMGDWFGGFFSFLGWSS
jgi:virulence factor Mce-like protein